MIAKPVIPPTNHLAEGVIPAKWILWFRIVPDSDPKGSDYMNDLASTALSLNEFWQRSHAKWTHLEERQQKLVADIVNVLHNSWGHEEIEFATTVVAKADLLWLLETIQPGDSQKHCRFRAAIKMMQEYDDTETCLLEMVWGW